uniref:Glycosyltransferase family 92 protein n=1 Tax=Leptobrachium leishanense TaxID=445787 RepID=A0A8C5PF33_9ANUR
MVTAGIMLRTVIKASPTCLFFLQMASKSRADVKRKCFFMFNLLVIILSLFYYFNLLTVIKNPGRAAAYAPNIANSSITALGDNQTFILSPYYDPRRRISSVRVLAIIHDSVKELYCSFYCFNGTSVAVRGHIEPHNDRFGHLYGTAALLCREPRRCPYRYISIHWSKHQNITHLPIFEVRNRPPPAAPSVNFTVCISTMYGNYNNVLQTIQSLEMYKLLGAGRVTLYLNQCHQNLEKVLRYYVEEGILEVIPWPIDRFLQTSTAWQYSMNSSSQVGYYGQTATLNDCLYRNMYRSKFVFLNDIDEIILPVMHHDWPSLMESLQERYPETSVFSFMNHVFPSLPNDTRLNMWRDIPGVNILQNGFKEPATCQCKLLVNPRKVYQTSIHSVLKHDGRFTNLPVDLAFNYHCKERPPAVKRDLLVEDRTIWRYNVSLQQNVNKVIQRVSAWIP